MTSVAVVTMLLFPQALLLFYSIPTPRLSAHLFLLHPGIIHIIMTTTTTQRCRWKGNGIRFLHFFIHPARVSIREDDDDGSGGGMVWWW